VIAASQWARVRKNFEFVARGNLMSDRRGQSTGELRPPVSQATYYHPSRVLIAIHRYKCHISPLKGFYRAPLGLANYRVNMGAYIHESGTHNHESGDFG
jgi:hypothetical protein